MSLLIRIFLSRKSYSQSKQVHSTTPSPLPSKRSRVYFSMSMRNPISPAFSVQHPSQSLSAASIAIAVGTHIVNHGVNRGAVHAKSKGLKLILVPVLFVNSNDVVLAHPFFSHLAIDASKIASPSAAIVFNTFFATRFRPRRVPREIRLMPDRVSSRFA